MRGRIVFILMVVLVVAAIAALNWPEFSTPEPLSFGVVTAVVPVGVTMLVLIAAVLFTFLVSSAVQESRYLAEHRRQGRALQVQRELAEEAEASRFTELSRQLDAHIRESRMHESIAAAEFDRRLATSHRELQAQLERMHKFIAGHLVQIESRIETVQAVGVAPRDTAPV